MMLTLGLFVFQLQTLPYQNMQRNVDYRWPSNSRVGQRPALQFLGIEEEKITLSGELLPEITGGKLSLLMLETMADQGRAWPLIEGSGTIYGVFVVNSISQKKTDFFPDGNARRIEFTVTLTRVDSSLSAMLGDLRQQAAGLLGNAGALASKAQSAAGGLLA
ncbi:phage tail protein [Brenneria goodwinii]|uniref:phage tail protein n=1 Tax=Brenneria goodwinii TaxID=1109412 RepID=UPI0036F07709